MYTYKYCGLQFIVVSGSWQTPPHKHYFPQVTSNRWKLIIGLSSSKIQSLSPLAPTDTLTKITQVTNYTTTTTTTILSSIPVETVLHREDDNECAPNFRTSQVWVNEACSFVLESLIRWSKHRNWHKVLISTLIQSPFSKVEVQKCEGKRWAYLTQAGTTHTYTQIHTGSDFTSTNKQLNENRKLV